VAQAVERPPLDAGFAVLRRDGSPNADRRRSWSSEPEKITPLGPGGKRRTSFARACSTTPGSGTVPMLLVVLGGPNVGACARTPVADWNGTSPMTE